MTARRITPLLPPLLLAAGLVAARPGPRLAEWLAALPEARLARAAPELVAWRRKHPDLLARLTRFAREGQQRALRAGALRALAALADDPAQVPALEGDLAPLVATARARATRRRQARAQIGRAARAPDQAAALAAKLDAAAAAELLDLALDPLEPAARRQATLQLLGWRGGAELDAALPRLLSADPALLTPLLAVLQQRNELVDAARRLFRSAAPTSAKSALAAWLGRHRVTGAANALRRLERRPELTRADRCAVQVALIALDPTAAATHAPPLVEAALAGDGPVADAAVAGLTRAKHVDLGPHLLRAFAARDPGGARRVRAIQVAEVLAVETLVPRLGELLLDAAQPLGVRQAAAHALGALATGNDLRPLASALTGDRTERAGLRREAADAAARAAARRQLPAFLLKALEGLLPREAEPQVRIAILRALAASAAPSSRAALTRLLARSGQLGAREAALLLHTATRLGQTDRASAKALLDLGRLRDPELGAAQVAYAAKLSPSLAVPALLRLLGHRAPRVARSALEDLLRRWPAKRRAADERTPPATRPVPANVRARWAKRWKAEPGTFR